MEYELHDYFDSIGDVPTCAAVTSRASQSYIINKCNKSILSWNLLAVTPSGELITTQLSW